MVTDFCCNISCRSTACFLTFWDRDFSTIRNLVTVIIKSGSLRRRSSTSIRKWFSYQFVSKMDPPSPTLKRNAAKGDREINATSVTMPLVRQEILGHIWKNIIAIIQMQPMWLCNCSCTQVEVRFENPLWRKIVQMRPMWLWICSDKQFEDTFENS